MDQMKKLNRDLIFLSIAAGFTQGLTMFALTRMQLRMKELEGRTAQIITYLDGKYQQEVDEVFGNIADNFDD
jgi:hypothetical protein